MDLNYTHRIPLVNNFCRLITRDEEQVVFRSVLRLESYYQTRSLCTCRLREHLTMHIQNQLCPGALVNTVGPIEASQYSGKTDSSKKKKIELLIFEESRMCT